MTGFSMRLLVMSAVLWLCLSAASSYKFLIVTIDMSSHVLYVGRVADLLVTRGHQVTFLLPSNIKVPEELAANKKIQIVKFNKPGPTIPDDPVFKESLLTVSLNPSVFNNIMFVVKGLPVMDVNGKILLADQEIIDSLASASYDFVIVDPASMPNLLIPYKLDLPFGYITSECLGLARRIPNIPSVVPHLMTSYTDQMSFSERLNNFMLHSLALWMDIGGYKESAELVPERPVVGYNALLLNASLCIQLREPTLDFARPQMPDMISVSQVMAREAGPLPSDLQKLLDQSRHGVIIMCFGSMVNDLPMEVIHKLLSAFAQLKYEVIMKYGGPLEGVPSNVHVLPWLPQNALLGQPQVKAFITHCGLNSLLEAVFHAVPLISFPFNIDQHSNAALAAHKGISVTLAIGDFTTQQLVDAITMVTSEPRFRENAERVSRAYRDVLPHRDPVFWLEHVIEFGAGHLRSAAYDLPRYQYVMVDVIALLVVISMASLYVTWLLGRWAVGKLWARVVKRKVE